MNFALYRNFKTVLYYRLFFNMIIKWKDNCGIVILPPMEKIIKVKGSTFFPETVPLLFMDRCVAISRKKKADPYF